MVNCFLELHKNDLTKIFFFLFVVDFVIHWNETAMGLHVFPIPIPPPPPSPPASSRFSQCTRSERLSHAFLIQGEIFNKDLFGFWFTYTNNQC